MRHPEIRGRLEVGQQIGISAVRPRHNLSLPTTIDIL